MFLAVKKEFNCYKYMEHTINNIEKTYNEYVKNSCYPPGHFYNPIISIDEIKIDENRIWDKEKIDGILGIDLNTKEQIKLVKEFYKIYEDLPFKKEKTSKLRFYYGNKFYSYTDAIFLYSMIRYYNPKKIVEVGSGFSSALMLDVNELFFDNKINLTFIEPYPDRLMGLIKENEKSTTIIKNKIQETPINIFKELSSGDILFIDSSHIVKTGSDVSFIINEVLPILNKGVIVHFHDIFYPFEYPKSWVFGGRNWNESYFIKSFLMYNNSFEIMLFSSYLHKHHSYIFEYIPLCYKNSGGNLWIRKK